MNFLVLVNLFASIFNLILYVQSGSNVSLFCGLFSGMVAVWIYGKTNKKEKK